jgi:hypothetical protein
VALRAMTRDERLTIYVELEREFNLKRSSAPAKADAKPEDGRRHCKVCGGVGHNSRSCKKAKKNKTANAPVPNKHTTKYPSYAYLAEKFIRENPYGVRTMEVSRAIGQSIPGTFKTLELLKEQGRVERHGKRYNTLWTLPGMTPEPRVETIDAAIIKVLRDAKGKPIDGLYLVQTVTKIVNEAQKKKPRADSITTALYKLIAKNIIAKNGANEHGPMYVAVEQPKGELAGNVTLN